MAGGDLVVFAAASLKGVLDDARDAWASAHPGATLTIATDSSAALAVQIGEGAPADVFLGADTATAERLVDDGLAVGPTVPVARNALAIVVPASNPARIASPADLGRTGVKVIAAGEAVPITAYATELITNLERAAGAPRSLAVGYARNVVSREDNVKAVIAKIELGEGDAAIVYATDAAASDRVAVIGIPAGVNVAVTYAGAVLESSRHPEAAAEFLRWLTGPDGGAMLAAAGFLPPA